MVRDDGVVRARSLVPSTFPNCETDAAVPFTSLATPGFSPAPKLGGQSLSWGKYWAEKISTDSVVVNIKYIAAESVEEKKEEG